MTPLRRVIRSLVFLALLSVLAIVYIGLQGSFQGSSISRLSPLAQVSAAQALISDPTAATSLSGQMTLTEVADGLQIEAAVSDAPPGNHGFHIHEMGSCAEAGNAAGGHFNPDGVKHGLLRVDGFEAAHAGDLGNILVTSDGKGSMSQTLPGLRLSEGQYAIANRAVILHAQRDDFGQPTGNAGGRIGCGIITTATTPNS
jgi:superoxide dismutase, Cu-Zn family